MENQIFIEKNNDSRKFNGIQNQKKENEIFISKKFLTHKRSKLKDSQVKFITKKNFDEIKEYKKKSSGNFTSNEGRWSEEEQEKFLEGIVLYSINWKKVKTLIETRTLMQVRSHAQKFFYKMKLCKDEILGIDFTSNKICNIRDMINQIKNNNSNYNIINVFKYLIYKCDNIEKSRKKIKERNNKNIVFKRSGLNNQSNAINLKEDNSNINDNNFFFNQNNTINKLKRIKETQNINNNELINIAKMINQNNIFNILQNLLTMNYHSNSFNSLFLNNSNFSINDITNNDNKLLNNYLISNKTLNVSNIINENALLSLALQNNILSNINNINYIHNINNNINLKDINFYNNTNNDNNIRNINNGNIFDKVKNNDENNLFNNIGKKDNINLRDNNNNDYNDNFGNKDNQNYNININKNDLIFYSDKQLNKINDKKKNNNDENSDNNNIFN